MGKINLLDMLVAAFGLDTSVQDLDALQMVLRACMAFFFTLLVIKAGKRRFMSKASAFDVVMVIILGSVISRAINGSAPVLPTLAASIALVLMHRVVSWLGFHLKPVSRFIEGEAEVLVKEGCIDWDAMRRHDITEKDLHAALRREINADDLNLAKFIVIESNGSLTVVRK
jgi:uncharacterized membrane protein YcaP (DUF421 family)